MTTNPNAPSSSSAQYTEPSLVETASELLRRRRFLLALGVLGMIAGAALGLSQSKSYRTSATFIPQTSDASATGGGLAAIAISQFGLRAPGVVAGAWGPPMYVELLKSRVVLESIAMDSLAVAEEGNRLVAVIDLLNAPGKTLALRKEAAIRLLRTIIVASEDRKLGIVKIDVDTKWASASLAIVERLLDRLNAFNLETRKTQAVAERQFVERESLVAEQNLRTAENQLQRFLQRNRIALSPELSFERDRLGREVALRQQLYTTWMQNREDARIREVRDTPVLTIIEVPRLAVNRQPRGTVLKSVIGGVVAAIVAALWIVLSHSIRRNAISSGQRELIEVLRASLPQSLSRVLP